MHLSEQAIEDFKRIYLAKRGIQLTDDEARHMALKLLKLASISN